MASKHTHQTTHRLVIPAANIVSRTLKTSNVRRLPAPPLSPGRCHGAARSLRAIIDELTADDYDEDQRLAWVASAEDADEFRARLGGMLTLVVQLDGEYLGFGSLKDNKTIDMLYVHPDFAGEGVGTALADALEKIAGARGAEAVTADVERYGRAVFRAPGLRRRAT